jgi:hypothetical protein
MAHWQKNQLHVVKNRGKLGEDDVNPNHYGWAQVIKALRKTRQRDPHQRELDFNCPNCGWPGEKRTITKHYFDKVYGKSHKPKKTK